MDFLSIVSWIWWWSWKFQPLKIISCILIRVCKSVTRFYYIILFISITLLIKLKRPFTLSFWIYGTANHYHKNVVIAYIFDEMGFWSALLIRGKVDILSAYLRAFYTGSVFQSFGLSVIWVGKSNSEHLGQKDSFG